MAQWLIRFWNAAKSKLTTYVLGAAASAQLIADHADLLKSYLPQIAAALPQSPAVKAALHVAAIVLTLAGIFTRVRRELKQ